MNNSLHFVYVFGSKKMNIDFLKEHFNYYLENERVFLDTERYV